MYKKPPEAYDLRAWILIGGTLANCRNLPGYEEPPALKDALSKVPHPETAVSASWRELLWKLYQEALTQYGEREVFERYFRAHYFYGLRKGAPPAMKVAEGFNLLPELPEGWEWKEGGFPFNFYAFRPDRRRSVFLNARGCSSGPLPVIEAVLKANGKPAPR